MGKKNNYLFYNVVSNLIKALGNLYFAGKVIDKENIPQEGGCLLAGNHVSNYDSYLLFKGTKRPIHILGKIELFQSPFGWVFKKMHLIPVDRNKKNEKAINTSIELLNDGKIVGIFPEGTFHKETLLRPFKPGVIHLALKTNVPIIPFAIQGEFKFRSHPVIRFGKPIFINEVKEEDKLKYLEKVVEKMLKNQ